uniref:ATP-binding cassette sub-family B member 10, mitochondrial n=1 Tax=Tigriopus japonicus TaxID=158387 RepID=A0A0A7ARB9_TIGJA|nr:ATP-binding cassette transporter sub-family B member 10 [Tigriopus japonicus]
MMSLVRLGHVCLGGSTPRLGSLRSFHVLLPRLMTRPNGAHRSMGGLRFQSSTTSQPRLTELKRLKSLFGPEKVRLTGALGLLLVSSGVTMLVPFALGKIIDVISSETAPGSTDPSSGSSDPGKLQERLKSLAAGLLVVFTIGALCNFGRVYLMRISSQNVAARLRQDLFASIMRQETTFFDKSKTGELVNRLSSDTQLVSQTITQQVSDGTRSLVMTSAGVGMMMFMSPELTVVGLSVVPPVALWAVWMGKRVKSASKELQQRLANLTEQAEEKISNIRTVLAFASQKKEITIYNERLEQVVDQARREAEIHAKFYGLTGFSGNLIILSVLSYGGSLVANHSLTVGELASFVLYAAYVGIGLNGVSNCYAEVMKGLGASQRIWNLMETSSALEVVTQQPRPNLPLMSLPSLEKAIVFSNVSFAFPTRPESLVLNNLSFTIPANQTVAVVGTSGSGKTTLISLLLRLYDPAQGQICFDDNDIKSFDVAQHRRRIGLVPQEPVLFSTSIAENILYGLDVRSDSNECQQEKTMSLVHDAAREVNAHEFIMQFPEGYNTLVGERGIFLSGGQKQRVAIARAIIKDPDVLVLDEATSALDAKNENIIRDTINRVRHNRTVLIIAHRLSTIRNADKIIVLRQGQVVEEGSFQELANLKGHFHEMVTKQSIS